MDRRAVGCIGLGLAAFLAVVRPEPLAAQTWPDRTVRMIVAFPAGGSLDTLARIIAQKLGDAWGQSVQIENRAGGAGNVGAAAAARTEPDGYTLHFGAQSLAVNVTLAPFQGFDPVKDFDPIILVATAQDVLMVPPDSPFRTVGDLIAHAKANPGKVDYATLGTGSSGHLATVLFSDLAGIRLQQVPYTSLSQAATDLMAGRTSLWIATLGGHLGNLKAGKVRGLAVSGTMRSEQLPDVPTFKELGIAFVDETSWYGIYAPKGTPKPIIDKINGEVERVLALPDVKERMATLGFRAFGGPPDRLAAMLRSEIEKWAEVAKGASLVAK